MSLAKSVKQLNQPLLPVILEPMTFKITGFNIYIMPIPEFLTFNVEDVGWKKQAKQKARSQIKKLWQQEMKQSPTYAEAILWDLLKDKQLGVKFSRQAILHGFIVDFWCAKRQLIVEVDGNIHNKQKAYDKRRDEIFKAKNISTLRFTNKDVVATPNACIKQIQEYLM